VSTVLSAEIASKYGCLDTDAVIDGDASHAHVLRELARSTNRLIEQSSPVINLAFDSSDDLAEAQPGAFEGYLSFHEWRPLISGTMIAPKKAHHRTLTARLIVKVTSGKSASFQISTSAAPFDPSGDTQTTSTATITGTGAWQIVEIEGIAAGNSETEEIAIWVRGSTEGSIPSAATYGGPVSGSHDFLLNTRSGEFELESPSTATWNTQIGPGYGVTFADEGRFALVVKTYTTRALMVPPLRIVGVWPSRSGTSGASVEPVIRFQPPPPPGPAFPGLYLTNDSTAPFYYFEITELCEYRVASAAIYSGA